MNGSGSGTLACDFVGNMDYEFPKIVIFIEFSVSLQPISRGLWVTHSHDFISYKKIEKTCYVFFSSLFPSRLVIINERKRVLLSFLPARPPIELLRAWFLGTEVQVK